MTNLDAYKAHLRPGEFDCLAALSAGQAPCLGKTCQPCRSYCSHLSSYKAPITGGRYEHRAAIIALDAVDDLDGLASVARSFGVAVATGDRVVALSASPSTALAIIVDAEGRPGRLVDERVAEPVFEAYGLEVAA